MSDTLTRRRFIEVAAAAMAAPPLLAARPTAQAGELAGRIKKAVKYHMIQEDLSVADKFKLLGDLGFDGVEIVRRKGPDPAEVVKAREATGLPVHGITNSSDPDIAGAIDLARLYGATSVLLVAGRVTREMPYDENYRLMQERIRKALEYAEKHQIKLLVENVWNNFLLSPLEMARFVDELDSPWAGVYFDVGNVVHIGWPEQWIRILGPRIGKLDVKEYSRTKQYEEGARKGFDVEIGDPGGDCGWPAVREALLEMDYRGWATAEVPGGDRVRLADVARRMDRVLELE
jgi:hexulose-6-phosphate isomerase